MKKNVIGLADYVGKDSMVRISRKGIDKYYLEGFVLSLSDQWLLLHVSDGNTLQLNGYSAMRVRDISSWIVDQTFIVRAMRLLNRTPVMPSDIDISDLPSLLASAQRQYSLLKLEMERTKPDCCYIGKLAKLTARRVKLKEVNPDGQWDDEIHKYAFKDITQVAFGDGYTEALAALVIHEAK